MSFAKFRRRCTRMADHPAPPAPVATSALRLRGSGCSSSKNAPVAASAAEDGKAEPLLAKPKANGKAEAEAEAEAVSLAALTVEVASSASTGQRFVSHAIWSPSKPFVSYAE